MGVSWLKSISMILLSSFIGIMSNPEILTASDSVTIVDLDKTSIVETVEIPEPVVDAVETAKAPSAGIVEPEVVINKVITPVSQPVSVNNQKVQSAPVATNTQPKIETKTVSPKNKVSFSWGEQELFKADSTGTNAGQRVAKMGTLIWGHNWTDFGKITSLKLGSTFTMTENGVTTKYKVVPNPIDGKAGVVLDKTSETSLSYANNPKYSNITMGALVKLGFGGHDLVLMTCYGSNSRYVVVADAI